MVFTAWVGNLPKGVTEEDVDAFCTGYGKITEIHVRSSSKQFFAFVNFEDDRRGVVAVSELNGKEFNDSGVKAVMRESRSSVPTKINRKAATPNRGRSRSRENRDHGDDDLMTLWMGGLPRGVEEEEVFKFVKGYGTIVDIHIRSSEKDVFAFVTFESTKLATECMRDMDQTTWFGMHDRRIQFRSAATKRPNRDRRKHTSPTPLRRGEETRVQRNYRIELRDLPSDMTWAELKDIARDFGRSISRADVFAAGGLTCGVVEYHDLEDARRALDEFDGRRIEGRRYRIQAIKGWS